MNTTSQDERYCEELLAPLRKCAAYRPKFGASSRNGLEIEVEMNAEGFSRLYGADPLYQWLGLNSPLMYAAHKAAGGMTSIYRQLGIGCERLVRSILTDSFGLSREQMQWTYDTVDEKGKTKTLTLDARIDCRDITSVEPRMRFAEWLVDAGRFVSRPNPEELVGVIFEVRQGYKSADAKRQNADIAFGTRAGLNKYLPAIMVISTQISVPVIARYRSSSMLVLTGSQAGDSRSSTLAFFNDVVGYSLSQFFERNSPKLSAEFEQILALLLSPST